MKVKAVELLTILFIALKLCHVINWSWWWVLSPTLITVILIVLAIAMAAFGKWITKPRTPAEKLAAACNEMAEALRNQRR